MNNSNYNKVQAEAQEITSALDKYRIKGGVADGLIPEQKIDIALENAMTKYCRKLIKTANDIDSLKINLEINEAFADLLMALDGEVFTGKIKSTLDKSGNVNKTPITKSPRCGFTYTDQILERVIKQLVLNWEPKTPNLKHNPNPKRFLEICQHLFPNVVDPHVAANGLREFIENVHNSCGTPNAVFLQRALWLYSQRTGGTGKSFLMELIKEAADNLKIDAGCEIIEDSGYLNPSIGLHTITISDDTPLLDKKSAENMNNIIGRTIFHYNIKYGGAGNAKSVTNLILGSNYSAYLDNERRYNEVKYVQGNNELILTDEEKTEYFPFWNNRAQGVAEIIEAFEVCPFRCEHDPWEKPIINNDLFAEEAKPKYVVGDRYLQLVIEINETIDSFKDDPFAKGDISKMYPTAFVKLMVRYNKLNYKETLSLMKSFLTDLKTKRVLPSRQCSGKCDIELIKLNWYKIADMLPSADETETNALAATRDEWNALIANEIANEK